MLASELSETSSGSPPILACVLEHWYALRAPGKNIESGNNLRYTAIKNWNVLLRARGLPHLYNRLENMLAQRYPAEPVLYILGAAYYPDLSGLQQLVLNNLQGRSGLSSDFLLAAIYASTFYLDKATGAVATLTERAILSTGDAEAQRASQEALGILVDSSHGRKCRLCGRQGPPSYNSLDWVPKRSSPG